METLRNAVAVLIEDDIVREGHDGRLEVDGSAAAGHIQRMDRMVRP